MLSFETRTILVQNYIAQDEHMGCSMPFSWRIKDYLEELCVHVLQNEGKCKQSGPSLSEQGDIDCFVVFILFKLDLNV